MMSKHGHKALGRCRICKAEIYEKNGKPCCPNCGIVIEASTSKDLKTEA